MPAEWCWSPSWCSGPWLLQVPPGSGVWGGLGHSPPITPPWGPPYVGTMESRGQGRGGCRQDVLITGCSRHGGDSRGGSWHPWTRSWQEPLLSPMLPAPGFDGSPVPAQCQDPGSSVCCYPIGCPAPSHPYIPISGLLVALQHGMGDPTVSPQPCARTQHQCFPCSNPVPAPRIQRGPPCPAILWDVRLHPTPICPSLEHRDPTVFPNAVPAPRIQQGPLCPAISWGVRLHPNPYMPHPWSMVIPLCPSSPVSAPRI